MADAAQVITARTETYQRPHPGLFRRSPGREGGLQALKDNINQNIRGLLQDGARAPKGASDSAVISPESRIEAASEGFGQALQGLGPEDKKALGELHKRVEAYAQEQESAGRQVNRSRLFAGEAMSYAMHKDPEGKDSRLTGLFDAGANYVKAYDAPAGR